MSLPLVGPASRSTAFYSTSRVRSRNAIVAGLVQVACHEVAGGYLPQRRLRIGTARHCQGATRMKPAPARRVERRGDLARKDDLLFQLIRTGEQERRGDGPRVGVPHVIEQQP